MGKEYEKRMDMFVSTTITSLYSRNCHSIVSQLNFDETLKNGGGNLPQPTLRITRPIIYMSKVHYFI